MSASRVWSIDPTLDLRLERTVDVSPEMVWAAWTQPEHIKHWFVPKPWTIADCEVDLRPGGIFRTDMRSPDGEIHPNVGCYLEIVPNTRLVWTDALQPGYRPAAKSFMTGIIEIEAHSGGTRYTATALHADIASREQHEAMGFHDGWGTVLTQLVEYVKSL